MRIGLALVFVLGLTSVALAADPSLSWDMINEGGGLYRYEFTVHANDGQELSFHVDLTFAGTEGGVVQQMQYNPGTPQDVDEQDLADAVHGLGSPAYDKYEDSYVLNPFTITPDGTVTEGTNSYYVAAATAGGQEYGQASMIQIVRSGTAASRVAWTGTISRDGVNYAADGNTIPGDANFDQKISVGDVSLLADNWGDPGPFTWAQGDFNGDQAISVGDVSLLSDNWGEGAGGGAAVPERLGHAIFS